MILEQLIRLPPKAQIVTGVLLFCGGIVVTIGLWGRGVIWGLTVFMVVVGFLLVLTGISRHFRQRHRETFLQSIQEHRQEILAAMVDAKRQGRNPVRFLNEKGIHDAALRTELIEEMNRLMS